jgi:transposase InsO family protein
VRGRLRRPRVTIENPRAIAGSEGAGGLNGNWFNNRRLLSSIGDIPPAEFEAMYYENQEGPATAVGLN